MCYSATNSSKIPPQAASAEPLKYDSCALYNKVASAALLIILFIAVAAATVMGTNAWLSCHKVYSLAVVATAGGIALAGALFCLFLAVKINDLLSHNPFLPKNTEKNASAQNSDPIDLAVKINDLLSHNPFLPKNTEKNASAQNSDPIEEEHPVFKSKEVIQGKITEIRPNNINSEEEVDEKFTALKNLLAEGLSPQILLQHRVIKEEDVQFCEMVLNAVHLFAAASPEQLKDAKAYLLISLLQIAGIIKEAPSTPHRASPLKGLQRQAAFRTPRTPASSHPLSTHG
jgi:hypothetical protein